MRAHGPGPQCPLVDVQLEIHTQRELSENWHEEDVRKGTVRAREKFPTPMRVPEYETT